MTLPASAGKFEKTEFREELKWCWRQIPNKSLFFAMFLGWVLLFQFFGNSTLGYVRTRSLFGWLNYVYQQGGDDQHGYLIPLVVLALLWHKRAELLAARKDICWPALGILTLAVLLHLVGFLIQQVRISVFAFFVGLYGLMGLTWGWYWLRVTFFPFFLFGFCIPISTYTDFITLPLRMLVTNITVALCHTLFGMEIVQNGTSIFDPGGKYQYEVAPACSGIRSLTAIFAITLIYAFVGFRQPWRRASLVLSAIPLAIVSNLLRLMLIILAAEIFGQAAGNYVHESAWFSLVPYIPAVAGVFLFARFLREKPRGEI